MPTPLTLVFSGVSLPDVVFDVMENKILIGEKILEIGYRLVNENRIMCQLADITENERLQQDLEEENTQREMLLRAVTSKRYFTGILEEADNLFATLESFISEGNYTAGEEDNERVIRDIHTFKANAAFLRMGKTVELAHNLESTLIDYGILSDVVPLGAEIIEFKKGFKEDADTVIDVLGEEWVQGSNTTEVDLDALKSVQEYIREKYPEDRKLMSSIGSFASLPLSILFSRLTEMAEHLAATNGKRVDVTSEANDVQVQPELYSRLSDAVNHIIRNMVTHGIEFPRHREKGREAGCRYD